ncbi:MAG TPA: hypothetical protein VF838_07555 [Trebonia sp.]
MSEFDKLKDDAEQYAKDHPEQVQKAEQDAEHAVESKFGIGGDQGEGQQDPNQPGQDQQNQDQQDQNQQNQGQ